VRAIIPSKVSQNPEAKSKAVATKRSHDALGANPYAKADSKARTKPMALTLLGVKPILWAAVAWEVSICWICFLSLVSKLTFSSAVLKVHYGVAVEKPYR
jgi:hypothetical protein